MDTLQKDAKYKQLQFGRRISYGSNAEFCRCSGRERFEVDLLCPFLQKNEILTATHRNGYWKLINIIAKRAACVAAIQILLGSGVMGISPVR